MYEATCTFIPPDVQKEVAKQTDGTAADAVQAELDKDARDKRTSAITASAAVGGAPLGVAPVDTGTCRREVYDSENGVQQRMTLVRAEGGPATADTDVTSAYDYSGLVRAFFDEELNRRSIDNRCMDLVLNVHFGMNYNNAFWDGDEMTFGDGDGVIFTGFAQSPRRGRA